MIINGRSNWYLGEVCNDQKVFYFILMGNLRNILVCGRIMQNVKGKLLLVHGMIDENVHFRHTARLVNALVAAGKPYELLIFPDERHMPRGLKDRTYMEQRIWEFIERNLWKARFSLYETTIGMINHRITPGFHSSCIFFLLFFRFFRLC